MRKTDEEEMKEELWVYFIMGRGNRRGERVDVLKEGIEGGIRMFEFGEKGEGVLEGEEKKELGRELEVLWEEGNVGFVVNDDVEVGIDVDGDGVDVGE
uniref:thiamine phosphate synthase n=1 Tax=Bacillus pumilus TaxID=1408 RepID=UPI0016435A97